MSLKVWLPLDGDLRNLGASNIEVTNNGATIDNNGKIGKCYHFGTSNSYIQIPKEAMTTFTTDCSVSFWLKINTWNSSYATFFQAGLGSAPWAHYIFGFLRNSTNSTICFTISNGSSASNASYLTSTIELNKWYHITLTYTTGKCKIYLNGLLDHEYVTSIIPAFSSITTITLGRCNDNNYQTDCDMNDFRIYDHCLSAAEVHEIAQGLIVHYKLDGFMGGAGDNLLKNSKTFGTGWSGSGTITANAFENYFSIKYKDNSNGTNYTDAVVYSNVTTVQPGEVYTGSFWAKADTSSNLSCFFYNNTSGVVQVSSIKRSDGTSGNSTDGHSPFTIDNQWRQYWVTWTFGSSGTAATKTFIVCRLNAGKSGISITKVKLEKGDKMTAWTPNSSELGIDTTIVEDSSGYNHNATTPSVLATTSDTPRYSIAATFDGTNYGYIQSTIVESSHLSSEYTWAGWIYRDYTDATARYLYNGITKIYLNTNFSTRMQWNHSKSDGTSSTNTSDMGIIIPYREWTHLVWTFKDGYLKIYINGEYKNYSDRTSTGQFIKGYTNQMIGTNTSSSGQWIGSISDMRIYTTALLDNDIKLLYNMGMRADNLQNLHTFEYKENTSNLFRSELIMPFAKTGYTEGNGNITTRNGSPAMDIRANIFYQNLENSTSGFLKGYFEANTSYVFDMWIDTDDVIYNGNNVAGGLRIIYTDNSFEHTFVFTGGNKGWQHKVYITPSNKTVDRIEVYYYVEQPVYCRLDSCICPLSNLKLHKAGIFEGTNLLEETNTKLIKNALIETNEIIEI